jgi:hypothetical protein
MDNFLKELELSLVAKAIAEQKVSLDGQEKSDSEQISVEGEKLSALEAEFFRKIAELIKNKNRIYQLAESGETSEEKKNLLTEILTIKQYAKQQEILIADIIKRSKNELKELESEKSDMSFAEKHPTAAGIADASASAAKNVFYLLVRVVTFNYVVLDDWEKEEEEPRFY